ncbi:hypothetical protein SVIOM342S_06938 [Streptomyces violaceorubidus]
MLLLAPLLLTAYGSEKAGGPGPSGPASAPAADAGTGELASRAQAMGAAPELVYVTEAAGSTLAQQSVGVLGDEGFSATWVSTPATPTRCCAWPSTGAAITAGTCADQPVGDMPAHDAPDARPGPARRRTARPARRHASALRRKTA